MMMRRGRSLRREGLSNLGPGFAEQGLASHEKQACEQYFDIIIHTFSKDIKYIIQLAERLRCGWQSPSQFVPASVPPQSMKCL